MTRQATQSLIHANDVVEGTCQQIKSQGECKMSSDLLQQNLHISSAMCLAQKQQAQCDAFFAKNPRFKQNEMSCSSYDVCRSVSKSTDAVGCERYGIRVKNEIVGALHRAGACLSSGSCVGQELVSGLNAVAAPVTTVGNFGKSVAQTWMSQWRKDRQKMDAMACLDPETQAEFSCYLIFHYGGAVLGTEALAEGAASIALKRMASLDAALSETAATAATKTAWTDKLVEAGFKPKKTPNIVGADLYSFTNAQGDTVASMVIATPKPGGPLVIRSVEAHGYYRQGFSKALLEQILNDHPEIQIIETEELTEMNLTELRNGLKAGLSIADAIRQTPAYKLRARFGFTRIVEGSINDRNYSFAVEREPVAINTATSPLQGRTNTLVISSAVDQAMTDD